MHASSSPAATALDFLPSSLSDPVEANTLWPTDNSHFEDYGDGVHFNDTDKTLEDFVRQQSRPDDYGLDIAGGTNGQALKDLLALRLLRRGLVTNYLDMRSAHTRNHRTLDHVSGDILAPTTWRAILAWQETYAPQGLGLIMHRPFGALQDLEPTFYQGAARLLIERLRPGGVFFAQIPDAISDQANGLLCRFIVQLPQVAEMHTSLANEDAVRTAVIIKSDWPS